MMAKMEQEQVDAGVAFGRQLKALRKKRGVSQQVVADFCEISRGALSHYENGRRVPKVDVADRIADYFYTGVDKLLGHDG